MISWSIDGAIGVHWDMKSHMGRSMTGTEYGTLQKQKFNTQSSMEAKLVVVDDCIMWTHYFFWKHKAIFCG